VQIFLHVVWQIPLPCQSLIISSLIKFQNGLTFLVLVYPGCPGIQAIKWVFFITFVYTRRIRSHTVVILLALWCRLDRTLNTFVNYCCDMFCCIVASLMLCKHCFIYHSDGHLRLVDNNSW